MALRTSWMSRAGPITRWPSNNADTCSTLRLFCSIASDAWMVWMRLSRRKRGDGVGGLWGHQLGTTTRGGRLSWRTLQAKWPRSTHSSSSPSVLGRNRSRPQQADNVGRARHHPASMQVKSRKRHPLAGTDRSRTTPRPWRESIRRWMKRTSLFRSLTGKAAISASSLLRFSSNR